MTDKSRLRQIRRWEAEQRRPRGKGYLIWLILLVTLIYSVDEIASQIGTLMKTEIAADLFARYGNRSVGALEILGAMGLPFQFLGLAYRPLADRFGRKLFLVVNTLGMAIALLLICLSRSIGVYFLGACLIQFFIPHDMHVVYIMEAAPAKHRARVYSSVKFAATLAVMLVPLLRRTLMENAGQWRRVYLIPAVLGLAASLIALLRIRETDTFLRDRLDWLRNPRQRDRPQGGLLTALKYAMADRQLKWLYITAALANIGLLGTLNYQVILSYGFAQGIYGNFSPAAMNAVSLGPVTDALVLFPVGCALSQLIIGFISDGKSRKAAALVCAADCLGGFLGFFFGARYGMAPWAAGLLCGIFVGSYYALNDVIIMMVGESAPTHLRSSVMSAQFIVTAAGGALTYVVGLPLITLLGNQATGIVSFGLLVPGFALALLVLAGKTADTRGVRLEPEEGGEMP